MLRTALLALLLALPMGAPTLAIQRSADELVPSPADFGPGWSLVSDLDVDALIQSPLVSGAGATLAGPGGARVLMLVVVVEPTPTAARRTWEFGNRVFDEARSGIDFDVGSGRDAGAPPEGCADARRGAGNDRLFGQAFPV
ncbi:MAG: hypothetical protein H0U10_10450, partial [Chloroflexia bacterium]|nr:hypothetical protein [Chloroflexia bacterium]